MPQDMKFRHATLTLDGTIQSLLAAFSGFAGGATVVNDLAAEQIILQPDGANANAVFVGGSTVTNADFGFSLPAGAAGVPPTPFKLDGYVSRLKPSQIFVTGTATQKLHITLICY